MFDSAGIWMFPSRACRSDGGATVGNKSGKNKELLWVSLVITVVLCVGGLFMAVVVWLMNHTDEKTDPFTFQVDSLTLNSITNNNSMDARFNLTLTVKTKEAKLFNTLETSIENENHLISSTNIDSFHQDSISVKTLHLQMPTAAQLEHVIIADDSDMDLSVYVRGQYWSLDNQVNDNTCDMIMVCEGVTLTLSYPHGPGIWTGSTKQGPFPCKYTSNDCVDF